MASAGFGGARANLELPSAPQGETPLEAARRELTEETGLPGDLIEPAPVEIARAFRWNGRDHEHPEWFYLARITKTDVGPGGLRVDESDNVLGYRWFSREEIRSSPERIEPMQLLEIIADLSGRHLSPQEARFSAWLLQTP